MQPIPLELLAQVFATFTPMRMADARRRAEVAVETLEATRSRGDRLQLGLALRALDAGPLRRFSGGSQTDRERALMAWATSPIPQQRTAFQALKRLALFLGYADPGADPAEPRNDAWEPIGYEPPARPAEPAEPLVRTLDVGRAGTSPLLLEADAVVVGSGAGGGVVAARLAAAGQAVLVVEAGGHRPEAEMPISEADAWREMLLDRGATSTDDLSFTILAGATLGGGTTVNWTTTIRPPNWLRDEWESAHGLIGLTSAETDADLARLEDELGLMPPTVVPPKDRMILDGARSLGWECDVTMRNAGPCTDCGGCTFGCSRGAKRSGLRVHLAIAQSHGARILVGARVTRLRHRSGAVEGVIGRLEPAGRPFAIRASQVVVAGGGLRTPVLLERSGLDHPALGRNLRLHPTVVVAARLAEAADMWIGPLQAARSLQHARPAPASDDGIGPPHGGFIIEAAPPHPGLAMAALPWPGQADAVARAADLRHLAPLIAIIRDQGSGRVRPTRSGRARIGYSLDRRDAASARRALVELSRLAHAGGAVELLAVATPGRPWRQSDDFAAYLAGLARIDTGANRLTLFSAHQMGTARAGSDPRASATDPWGRVRSDRRGGLLRGCYVGDGSLVPTAPGVNPMLTIMALAERTARAVLADRG
jgi:choline dehydrogenase-like flavoprotein